jgi:hypothetical protein
VDVNLQHFLEAGVLVFDVSLLAAVPVLVAVEKKGGGRDEGVCRRARKGIYIYAVKKGEEVKRKRGEGVKGRKDDPWREIKMKSGHKI